MLKGRESKKFHGEDKKPKYGSSQKRNGLTKPITVDEDLRIGVHLTLKKLMESEEEKEFEFPSSLTSQERAYIHRLALLKGLKSKSRDKGTNRYITVYKKDGSTIMQNEAIINLSPNSRKLATNILLQYPLTNKEKLDLIPQTDRERSYVTAAAAAATSAAAPNSTSANNENGNMSRSVGKLNSGIPQVPPPPPVNRPVDPSSLPIYPFKDEILSSIDNHQVTLITGETGSGKTTQIPQYLMELANERNTPIRIICTEPRRLAAMSISERVAFERDEKLGTTIGYQIRLESQISPRTICNFCTNGILLRTLMGGSSSDSFLGNVTHVIIDEVHERDRFSDFLITVMRDMLNKFRGLKLILMSATLDTELFTNYFPNSNLVQVPGRMFSVSEYHLEDILAITDYFTSSDIEKHSKQRERALESLKLCEKLSKGLELNPSTLENTFDRVSPIEQVNRNDEDEDDNRDIVLETHNEEKQAPQISESLRSKANSLLYQTFVNGNRETFDQVFNLMFNNEEDIDDEDDEEEDDEEEDDVSSQLLPIDFQHSKTGVTLLMAAAGRGYEDIIENLLLCGADPNIKANNGWIARDFALNTQMKGVIEILDSYQSNLSWESKEDVDKTSELSEEKKKLLYVYHSTFDDEYVDLDLIVKLIKFIMENEQDEEDRNGAILVFLPGYDEIIRGMELLVHNFRDTNNIHVLPLHSQIASNEQKKIYAPSPQGKRKIILSTNIAETSLTINDVTTVIDSGKVKEKSFDSICSISQLKTIWISKANSVQRKGRAGRTAPGKVYRLYSSVRFDNLCESSTPEILRTPLMDLCLQTKLLAPANTPIADYLARTLEPPSCLALRNAVQNLKTMEALDACEDVTELGSHLLDLPLEPYLGKILLTAIVLKCLDPILTIVASLTYKDPFHMVLNKSQSKAKEAKFKLSENSLSDHMTLLRSFQKWQKAKSEGYETSFLKNHCISKSTMETIFRLRVQILGQLRSSGFVRTRGSGDLRELNKYSENWAVIKAALTCGSYPNLVRIDNEHKLRSAKEIKVRYHPSSVLSKCNEKRRIIPSDWCIYDEMTKVGHYATIRAVTSISPITVLLFAGPIRLPSNSVSVESTNTNADDSSDSEVEDKDENVSHGFIHIDDWIVFKCENSLASLIIQLRKKWSSLFLRRLMSPSRNTSVIDDNVINVIVQILSIEDEIHEFVQPIGIGQRPKSMEALGIQQQNFMDFETTGTPPPPPPTLPTNDPSNVPPIGFSSSHFRYFIIKATSDKAIEISLNRGLWQFGNQTEKRLLKVLKLGYGVIIVFSIQGSGHFQGYARFAGHRSPEKISELLSQGGGSGSGIQYWIEWLKWEPLSFQNTRHLLNPYNENRKVQASRDGQEIEPGVGEALCALWERIPVYNMGRSLAGGGNRGGGGMYGRRNAPSGSTQKISSRSYVRY